MAMKQTWMKTVAVVVLLGAALAFAWTQYRKFQPPEAPPPSRRFAPDGPTTGSARRPGPPSPEERERFREELYAHIEITPEQRARLAAIEKEYQGREGREARREQFRAMEEVLTPEQREKSYEFFRERMRRRMDERLKALPEDQREKFKDKLEERMEQWRRRHEENETK